MIGSHTENMTWFLKRWGCRWGFIGLALWGALAQAGVVPVPAQARAERVSAQVQAERVPAQGGVERRFAAESELTLDEAIVEARRQSPQLQRSQAVAEEFRWRETEALSGFLPRFSVIGDHFFKIKYQLLDIPPGQLTGGVSSSASAVTFPLITPATTLGISGALPVFNGFENVNRYSAAKLGSRAAQLELDWTGFQIQQEVRRRFYRVLAAEQLADVAAQNVKNLEVHLSEVRSLLAAGEATRVDVLRVEVQLSKARSEKINADDNGVIAKQQLALALGRENESRTLAGQLPIPDLLLAERMSGMEPGIRSDIEAISLRSEATDRLESAASTWWVPALSVVGSFQWYNNRSYDVFNASDFRNAYQYGVELRWNLFDGLASYSRARQSAAQAREAMKTEEIARLQVPADFEAYRRRYRYNVAKYRARTEDLARSRESVKLALVGLRSGTQTSTDVLDAELDLFNVRASVIGAQLDAAEALIGFELAAGRSLGTVQARQSQAHH